MTISASSVQALLPGLATSCAKGPRLVIVDPQPLMREGIVARINAGLPSAQLVYVGGSLHAALEVVMVTGCDSAIIGTRCEGPITEVVAASAFAMHGIRSVILVERPSVQGMEAVLIAGAAGYIANDCAGDEFIRAVETVVNGGSWAPIGEMYRTGLKSTSVQLSAQERRALVLYASGLTQDAVGRRMGIKPCTVKHYLDRVREKYAQAGLAPRTKLELHALARKEGLLP
jgi:DNA-binding NarL/FixJ family response regulator